MRFYAQFIGRKLHLIGAFKQLVHTPESNALFARMKIPEKCGNRVDCYVFVSNSANIARDY